MKSVISVAIAAMAATGMALLVQGCGQKGPLRLPDGMAATPAPAGAQAASAGAR